MSAHQPAYRPRPTGRLAGLEDDAITTDAHFFAVLEELPAAVTPSVAIALRVVSLW